MNFIVDFFHFVGICPSSRHLFSRDVQVGGSNVIVPLMCSFRIPSGPGALFLPASLVALITSSSVIRTRDSVLSGSLIDGLDSLAQVIRLICASQVSMDMLG
jgi:hypothetical protein